MGNQASVPEKVYKAAKQNDVLTLKVKSQGPPADSSPTYIQRLERLRNCFICRTCFVNYIKNSLKDRAYRRSGCSSLRMGPAGQHLL